MCFDSQHCYKLLIITVFVRQRTSVHQLNTFLAPTDNSNIVRNRNESLVCILKLNYKSKFYLMYVVLLDL